MDEPTCRCHQNPFIGALVIQEPVIKILHLAFIRNYSRLIRIGFSEQGLRKGNQSTGDQSLNS